MRNTIRNGILSLALLAAAPIFGVENILTGVIPEVQQAYAGTGEAFSLANAGKIHAPADAPEFVRDALELWRREMPFLPEAAFDLAPGSFRLVLGEAKPEAPECPQSGFDAYAIVADARGIEVAADSAAGLFYAIQTLRQLADVEGRIPALRIRDWADQKWRICYLGVADPEWLLPKLARLKINMAIVESYWYGAGNWWFSPAGANREAAERFQEAARRNHVEVMPLIQGGGWAYGVVDRNPNCAEGVAMRDIAMKLAGDEAEFPHRNLIRSASLPIRVKSPDGGTVYEEERDYRILPGVTARPFAETNAPWRLQRLPGGRIAINAEVTADYDYVPYSPHQSPYCPSEPETYAILRETLENAVKIYDPAFIHIGHDEVIRRNTCSRCLARQLDKAELAGEDLRWWYDTIRQQNPAIQIMVWDDIFREAAGGGELLAYLPEDVIVCPWFYHADAEARNYIRGLLKWFLVQHRRPSIGTASGYFPENAVIWRDELRPYRDDPKYWGMMFSHWGESMRLWGSLPLAAEFMWSAERPGPEALAALLAAEYAFGAYGFRPALEYSLQRESMAQAVANGNTDVNALRQLVRDRREAILARRHPAFRDAVNPFPEVAAAQMERLADGYAALVPRGEPGVSDEVLAETVPDRVVDHPGIRELIWEGAMPAVGEIILCDADPGLYTVAASVDGETWNRWGEVTVDASGLGRLRRTPAPIRRLRVFSTEPKENINAVLSIWAAETEPGK